MANSRPLECTICLEEYKNPIYLNCGHSFCYTCLEKFIKKTTKNDKCSCPVCRTEFELLNEGMKVVLSSCSRTSNAEVRPVPNECKNKTNFCTVHKKRELEIYCTECEVIICSKCAIGRHQLHNLLDLDEEETETKFKAELSKLKTELTKLEKERNTCFETVQIEFKKFIHDGEMEILKVDAQSEALCKAVRENAEGLKAKIRKNIIHYREMINNDSEIMKGVQKSVADILILKEKSLPVVDVIKTIHKARKIKTEMAPNLTKTKCLKYLQFKENTETFKNIGSLTQLMHSTTDRINLLSLDICDSRSFIWLPTIYYVKSLSFRLAICLMNEDIYFYLIMDDSILVNDDEENYDFVAVDADDDAADDISDYSITLFNVKDHSSSITKRRKYCGYTTWRFLSWKDFADPGSGFIDNDNCFYVKLTIY